MDVFNPINKDDYKWLMNWVEFRDLILYFRSHDNKVSWYNVPDEFMDKFMGYGAPKILDACYVGVVYSNESTEEWILTSAYIT